MFQKTCRLFGAFTVLSVDHTGAKITIESDARADGLRNSHGFSDVGNVQIRAGGEQDDSVPLVEVSIQQPQTDRVTMTRQPVSAKPVGVLLNVIPRDAGKKAGQQLLFKLVISFEL